MASKSVNLLMKNLQMESTELNSSDFLLRYPRGAYTTARTVNRNSIFEFSFHVNRLVESTVSMIQKESEKEVELQELKTITSNETLRPVLLECLRTSFHKFDEVHPEHKQNELKVTILVTWHTPQALPSEDQKVGSESITYDIFTHLTLLGAIPRPPIKVQIRHADRKQYDVAKDSQWVRDRKRLEEDKPKDVNEIILMDDEGELLEGMSSNFYVLKQGVLQTAEQHILKGTVRDLLLHMCAQQNIPVSLQAPCISDWATWDAAFISSTSRLLLPINELTFVPEATTPAGLLAQVNPNPRVFDTSLPLVTTLTNLVRDHFVEQSESVL
eukprot:TRINITY_DN7165_c0_g1_i1.p1 TRINITY_DN7165_c0_g1~~TRINITY_DN7165_c0_g1_i1.p1  ORF type:complete len:328 (-),score=62.69 TRINITY_DN7165_c0_g1_i1:161-1144(-)